MDNWSGILSNLQGSTMQRLQGLEELQALADQGHDLERDQVHELVNIAEDLLTDNNHKVSSGALQLLVTLLQNNVGSMRAYVNILVPLVVERLGDARQTVRQEACGLLLCMLANMPLNQMLERMARFWSHRSWKVRHGLLQTMAEAISTRTPGLLDNLDQRNHIITSAVNLLEDGNKAVRDAAQDCLQELYRSLGPSLVDNLQQQSIRPAVLKDLKACLDTIAPTNLVVPDALTRQMAQMQLSTAGASSSSSNTAAPSDPTRAAAKRPPAAAAVVPAVAQQPEVVIVPAAVTSDKELLSEMISMVTPLAGTVVDWQQRITHIQRLQALALGCPVAMHDVLLEGLRQLRESLCKQVEDRRSAVSKQACQLLSVLSSVLGLKFQELLLYFIPILSKVLPITIQVMAEAADSCCLSLLHTCPTPKAIPLLVQLATKDKNAKIRQCCTTYLAVVLESWDQGLLTRATEEFETVMRTNCTDANADARAATRRIYAAYTAVLPDAARQFSSKLPASVLEKLVPGIKATMKPALNKPFMSRPSSATSIGSAGKEPDIIIVAPSRPATALATAASAAPPRPRPAAAVVDVPPLPVDGKRLLNSRKSMAAPGRVAGPGGMLEPSHADTAPNTQDGGVNRHGSRARRASVGPTSATALAASSAATRVPHTPLPGRSSLEQYPAASSHSPGASLSDTWPGDPYQSMTASMGPAVPSRHAAAASHGGGVGPSASSSAGGHLVSHTSHRSRESDSGSSSSKPHSLSRLTTSLLTGTKPWNEKVELLLSISEVVRAAGCAAQLVDSTQSLPADPLKDLERLTPRLLEWIDEPHAKVVAAALSCLADLLPVYPHALEAHMDRALPSLFARLTDQKDAIRAGAARTLQEASSRYSADLLLSGLLRALDANKQPRVKQAVLEFGQQHIGQGTPAGLPTQSSAHIKQWIRALSGLITDKHPDLRRSACDGLRAVYEHVDAGSVQAYMRHATGAEGMALRRLLSEIEDSQCVEEHTPAHEPAAQPSRRPPAPTTFTQPHAGDTPSHMPGNGFTTQAGSQPSHSPSSSAHTGSVSHGVGAADRSHVTGPAACGPRSFPIDCSHELSGSSHRYPGGATLPGMLMAGGGGGGAVLHSQQYAPQDYMSPAKMDVKASMLPYVSAPLISQAPSHMSDPGTAHKPAGLLVTDASLMTSVMGLTARATPSLSLTGSGVGLGGMLAAVHQPWVDPTPAPPPPAPAPITTAHTSSTALMVPGDVAAQTRLLNLLIVRMTGPSTVDALKQLKEMCASQVASSAWISVAPQLIGGLVRKVFPAAGSDVAAKEAGMELVRALALAHPALITAQGAMEQLLPGMMQCAAGAGSQVVKAAFEALSVVLDAVPLHAALSCLVQQLEAHSSSGGMLLHTLCTAVQKVVSRMSREQLVVHAPPGLIPLLSRCAEDSTVEVRKAAIYALAHTRNTLGEERFGEYAAQLTPCQLQLVSWAWSKIRSSEG